MPLLSKQYPDYSVTKSSGNSVALGDDIGQWEAKGERILAAHVRKNEDKAAKADAVMNDIEEIEEFMLGGRTSTTL
jgi:hypothetical protein